MTEQYDDQTIAVVDLINEYADQTIAVADQTIAFADLGNEYADQEHDNADLAIAIADLRNALTNQAIAFADLTIAFADLANRHYLARLHCQTLCCSKSVEMLKNSIRLLIHYLRFWDVPVPPRRVPAYL